MAVLNQCSYYYTSTNPGAATYLSPYGYCLVLLGLCLSSYGSGAQVGFLLLYCLLDFLEARMDVSSLLDGLNDKQREAVAAPQSSMLVLAGAGSGKTRVLTHRIAWLMQVEQQSPYSILAVTFTNKAAAEMRERVEKVAGTNMGRMWIGTFHGLAHRLLRTHFQDAGLPQSFQILDSDDQVRLIKRILKSLNLDENNILPVRRRAISMARKIKD